MGDMLSSSCSPVSPTNKPVLHKLKKISIRRISFYRISFRRIYFSVLLMFIHYQRSYTYMQTIYINVLQSIFMYLQSTEINFDKMTKRRAYLNIIWKWLCDVLLVLSNIKKHLYIWVNYCFWIHVVMKTNILSI